MRPILDSSFLCEPPPSTVRENERETARVPRHSWCPGNDVRFEPRYLDLTELDSILAARLIRLEIALGLEGQPALEGARAIRAPLVRAGACAEVDPTSVSFESALADTLCGVYAWLFGELDALLVGDPIRPLPKRLLAELVDHASVASMRSLLDESLASLEPSLLALSSACARFGKPPRTQ